MAVLGGLFTSWLNTARSVGNTFGYELVVETNPHTIDIRMEKPGSSDSRAWDPNLFQRGALFIRGYANPIKPVAKINKSMGERDTVDVYEGNTPELVSDGGESETHAEIISSPRFHSFMQQDLIESMVLPSKRWTTLVYLLIGIGALALISVLLQAFSVFG